jgi:hypothetical protein
MAAARARGHDAAVAQRFAHAENFVVVRWGTPEPADRAELEAAVPEIRRAAARPLVYVGIMDAETPPLGEPERRLLTGVTQALLPHCGRLAIVVEGRGFRGAIMRSAMTAVSLLSGRHDGLKIVDSIECALAHASRELPARELVLDAIAKLDAANLPSARVA